MDGREWLRLQEKPKRLVRGAKIRKAKAVKFVAYDEWDELALEQKADAEKFYRSEFTKKNGFNSVASRFVMKHIKSEQAHCLLIPFATGPQNKWARYVCEREYGAPIEGQVCRHLCGNGHMGCVNPKHLAWGSPSQNSQDQLLHHSRPYVWPDIAADVLEQISASDLPDRVLAVHTGIPAAIIRVLRKES